MKLYAGIDLHSNNNVLVILNDKGESIYQKRLENNLDVVLQALEPYKLQLSGVVVESTFNWYWLVDGLMDQGYKLHLANTAAIQQYNGIKHTNRSLVSGIITSKSFTNRVHLPEGGALFKRFIA